MKLPGACADVAALKAVVPLVFAFLLSFLPAVRAEDPKAPAPVPIPYPNAATAASAVARDPQSGLPTGQRLHKPWVLSASARKIPLADGRTFVVNAETAEVVFGDGVQGRRPEAGDVPKDGRYRVGGGAAGNVEVRAGRLVSPTPVPIPVPTRAVSKVK